MSHPRRVPDPALRSFDPVRWGRLDFEEIDHDVFRMYGLGVEAGRIGGTAPAVFNAANEVAVQGFLEERVGFLEMAEVVEATLDSMGSGVVDSLEDLLDWDQGARDAAEAEISRRHG
jgi:1-deoxy-D-xylulose-5-phosphate reductoisomerase